MAKKMVYLLRTRYRMKFGGWLYRDGYINEAGYPKALGYIGDPEQARRIVKLLNAQQRKAMSTRKPTRQTPTPEMTPQEIVECAARQKAICGMSWFKKGARVCVRGFPDEPRRVVAVYGDVPGGRRLDAPVDGFVSWNVADLVCAKRRKD